MPSNNVIPLHQPRPCPICGKPSTQAFHPFCSARCADIDLNRWLSGSYVIPGRGKSEDEDDGAPSMAPDNDDE